MWVFREVKRLRPGALSNLNAKKVYEVGYYAPNEEFIVMYEFDEKVEAALQIHFLNGGNMK